MHNTAWAQYIKKSQKSPYQSCRGRGMHFGIIFPNILLVQQKKSPHYLICASKL